MSLEQDPDFLNLALAEALHTALISEDEQQIAGLSRLQAFYHELRAEGLKPTPLGEVARPLREKLALEEHTPEEKIKEKIRAGISANHSNLLPSRINEIVEEVYAKRDFILNTRLGPLPVIEDQKTREFAERLNLQIGRSLEDKTELNGLYQRFSRPGPIEWIKMWNTLAPTEKALLSRSLYLYRNQGWIQTVGEVRTIDPLAMRGFRHAGGVTPFVLPTILERNPPKP